MRSLRWLLLVVLVLVAAAVLGTFRSQRRNQRARRRPVPPAIALDTKTAATDWEWGQSGNGQPKVKLFAKSFRQSTDGTTAQLENIELRIFHKGGTAFDRIRSGGAQFNTSDNKLFSPGEAEITLDVPVEGEPAHSLTSIKTSGINFDSKTGQAVSDQRVSFTFASGDGTCTGAAYDPETHVLNLNSNVVLNLHGDGPKSTGMKIETGHLLWSEATQRLELTPWSRLTRGQTMISAASSIIQMKDGQAIQWIDAQKGQGIDNQPTRQLDYSADLIHVIYNDDGVMDKMNATGNAKLMSHSPQAQTSMAGNRVEMAFNDENGEPVLAAATVTGKASVESRPGTSAKATATDTRILKSETIDLHMRPGGQEIERVSTLAPGTLEFLPGPAARHRRLLKADRMDIRYGADNVIRTFHATDGATETWPSDEDKKKNAAAAVAYTSSKTIDAAFDDSGQLTEMKQSEDFRYTEGTRKAQARSARLETARNVMTLETGARISDDTGSTIADVITLDQKTGDFDANGHAFTTRLPEPVPANKTAAAKSESALLDDAQPTQGSANRVTSEGRNRLIHYAGNAVVWQTANRIEADKIDIDREKKAVTATGKVVSQFQDAVSAEFTIVKAQRMVYTDSDRLAIYSGDVDFSRPALTVKSSTLRAYLNDKASGKDSRINRALADGAVVISQSLPDRKRIGTSEHGEYFPDDAKVVLTGGGPQLVDSKQGNTKGEMLTYFTNDERLLVNGAPAKQAQSHLRKTDQRKTK